MGHVEDEIREDRPGAAHGPGSVAEEAALLVELLAERGWGAPPRDDDSAGAREEARPGADSHSGTCTCGGSVPQACRVCPVCQLIAFVQQISPDAIERVADVVDLAATALRELAGSQRARRAQQDATAGQRTRDGGQP